MSGRVARPWIGGGVDMNLNRGPLYTVGCPMGTSVERGGSVSVEWPCFHLFVNLWCTRERKPGRA